MTDNRARKSGVSTPPYLCPDGSNPCGRYGYCGYCPHDKSKRMHAMTNKPEVALSERIRPNIEAAPWVCDEVKRIEAARAADKARIAELEECMKYARTVISVTVRSESISQVCHRSLTDEIARIDAALSHQRREKQ